MQDAFLIKLDDVSFYTRVDEDGEVCGTPYPNCSEAMSYDAADLLCRKFRGEGFPGATVVDRRGQPVLPADLDADRKYTICFHRGEQFFAGRNAQGHVLGSIMKQDAKRVSKPVAVEIQKRLRAAGYFDAAIVVNPHGRVAFTDELIEAWGKDWSDPALSIEEPEAPQGNFEIA